jgi:hypothetical protein
MRARAIFGILLVLIALVAFGPALIAVGSQMVAEAFGCQVDLNRVSPCEIGGKDSPNASLGHVTLGFCRFHQDLSNICLTECP